MLPFEAGDGIVAQEALECRDVVESALCYRAFAMFCMLHMLMENSQF